MLAVSTVADVLAVVDALLVTFCVTCTILFTGSVTTFSEITVFSISLSFWYFILYVISFKPSFPSCNTLFVVFFVTVSYGIATCSTTIFSVIGA